MGDEKKKINVFEYDDFRAFLRDWYDNSKRLNRNFSHRAFAMRAGLNSTNFFMLVMQGKRNLTEESIKKISLGLKLNKQENDFFRNLVFFNQAKSPDDKSFYYRRLLQSRKYRQLKPIEKDRFEYYSKWYHPVVRELVSAKNFDGTPEWIASHISPKVTAAQAARSVELLEKLGFIEKTSEGKWKQASAIVSTGPEVSSVVVHNYHRDMLDLSRQKLDILSAEKRDISAMTLGISKTRFEEIKAKIREFRQEILKTVSTDLEPEDVVQLNIQLFKVMEEDKGGDQS
jgi:uncharacterized protein (TIGR02147 family)